MKYILPIVFVICGSQLNAQVVKATTDSTQKKSNATVSLRCHATALIATEPLILVDGVIMKGKNDEIINQLNPSDIRSIDVIKGASAVTIYGSAGAAGVIRISTKNKCEDATSANEKCF